MASINKNFAIKNGIEVGENLIFGDKDKFRVGIGTVAPNYTLEVRGGIGATFVSVGQSITASTGSISSFRSTNVTVGGELNFQSGVGTGLNISGISTVGSLNIGSTEVIDSSRQLKNISSLDATTTATIEAAIANGPNTFTDLIVSGIATFNSNVGVAGIVTAPAISASWSQVGSGLTFTTGIGTNLNVSGVGTITTLNATGVTAALVSSTWSQVGSGLTFTTGIGTNLNVSGVVTSTVVNSTWSQVGSGLTFFSGIGTNLNVSGIITGGNLNITGLGTIGNIAFRSTGSSGGIVTAADNVGIITYYGDGSQLSGIGGAPGGVGANSQVVYNNSGSFAGSSNFTFDGDNVYISGIVTAQDFNSLSDARYKENINTVDSALLKIEQLRGVKFDWKESGLPSYGVVAQELEQVLPELIHGENPKTVNYNGIIGVLIEAIKELKAEVEELKKYK